MNTHATGSNVLETGRPSKKMLWAGYVLSGLVGLFLLVDAGMKIANAAPVLEAMPRLGYAPNLSQSIGATLLLSTVLYLVPRTMVLGAILLTAYLGGATATHVRIGDPFYFPVLMSVMSWAGLYLRDPRVRALIPLSS